MIAVKDVNILVNIVRAFDIPVRDDNARPPQNTQLGVRATTSNMSAATDDQRTGYNAATAEIKVILTYGRKIKSVLFIEVSSYRCKNYSLL